MRNIHGPSAQEAAVTDLGQRTVALKRQQPSLSRGAFYQSFGKRSLDVLFSALGLALFSPLLLLIAVAIKTTSAGPVLFRQLRVGRGGKLFLICKFRTMVQGAGLMGPGFTRANDPRVTPIGHRLRKWKLDELPQLWNVFRGEMSCVGPRPELPLYVDLYTTEQKQVLTVRPGITDPASLRYRNEGQLLQDSSDAERLYREHILPDKLSLNLQYMREISVVRDVFLILSTLQSVFRTTVSER